MSKEQKDNLNKILADAIKQALEPEKAKPKPFDWFSLYVVITVLLMGAIAWFKK